MKAIAVVAMAALISGLAGPSVAQQGEERIVIVNVEGLSAAVAERVREYAAKGPVELRRYLDRTNMIHGLRIEDVVRQPQSAQHIAQVRQRNDPREVVVIWAKQE